jgi:ABC-type multidrug transport system fused ATPase/permease subunit
MVALVGESGGGKSTIADLILRLFEPDTGAILVNDIPLREYLLADWRGKIGVVSQDAFLFHSSIRDNIAFGRLDATDLEIERAAKSAHAHDFIQKLEKQYDTIIGDRGHRLSGGQRQRIAIARAIVRRPEILVLDEATSDLDSNSERIIQRALDELRSNRTIIAIAHRLSTVAMADEILVMEQGRIVERGTHTKLLNSKGRYAHMWQLQTAPEHSESAEISTLGDVASVTEG